jgi:hypothetical protein
MAMGNGMTRITNGLTSVATFLAFGFVAAMIFGLL